MFGNGGPSLADIAAVTRNGNNGFGDGNGAWWILILLWAINGNGLGNNNRGNMGTDAEVQRGFDTSSIVGKLDRLGDGLCSLGYDQLGQINGLERAVSQGVYSIQNQATQNSIAEMQRSFAMQQAISDCCCQNREAIAQVRYDMSTGNCALQTQINQMGQAVMQNDNNNYRSLHDEIVGLQIAQKDQEIATLKRQIEMSDLRASQTFQTGQIENYVDQRLAYYLNNNNNCCQRAVTCC